MIDLLRRLVAPPARPPSVVVTAVLDATEGEVDAHALHRVRELSDAVTQSAGAVAASVDVYRGPRQAPRDFIDRVLASERAFPFAEPWSSRGAWQIDARKGPRPLAPQSDAATALAARLRDNQRRYPDALHVVYVYGHRVKSDLVAGMPVSRLGEALSGGADLLLLDTCWGSSVDTLAHIPSTVKTVVASETRLLERVRIDDFVQAVFETQFPLRHIALRLSGQTDRSPAAVAASVTREASRNPGPHVIAGTDMAIFHRDLLPSLNRLGPQLSATQAESARQTPVVDAAEHLADLAGFLRHLGTSPMSASAATAVRAAQDALTRTQVARSASPDMAGHGGLSFQAARLPSGWNVAR